MHRSRFSFGAITDIQYADADDAHNFDKTAIRSFRNSPVILETAVNSWNEERVAFVAQLGDLVDGRSKKAGQSEKDLKTVMDIFAKCNSDVHHLVGNHDLYNFERSDPKWKELFHLSQDGDSFYSFSPAEGFKVLVLDAYEISTCGPARGTVEDAWQLLQEQNKNDVRDDAGDWYKDMVGVMKRWVPPNGALSDIQLQWLGKELSAADAKGEKAIILSHVPLLPRTDEDPNFLWNYDAVMRILHEHTSVVLVLSGHDHAGGYVLDTTGVHHVTLPSPLNCKGGAVAFATVDVADDAILLRGRGDVPVMTLPYDVKTEEQLRYGSIHDMPNPFGLEDPTLGREHPKRQRAS